MDSFSYIVKIYVCQVSYFVTLNYVKRKEK